MAFVTPRFTRAAVERAGAILIAESVDLVQLAGALEVITNWRAAHAYPLNTFQATLRTKLNRLKIDAVVGQRLKRLPSIAAKLRRNETMNLQQMQDIAGLRAVVPSVADVYSLRENYISHSRFAHHLKGQDDYVQVPKLDGYRSVHLKYRYQRGQASAYNGLNVEIQLRTRLQHAWATAVETVDTFTGQAIKAGRPEPEWAEFFQLASAAFASVEESPLPAAFAETTLESLFTRLFELERQLRVRVRLKGFSVAVDHLKKGNRANAAYHLVVLNVRSRTLSISSFPATAQEEANAAYAMAEAHASSGAPLDPVLVAGGSVHQLRKAYPNYFLDTSVFVQHLDRLDGHLSGIKGVGKLRAAMGISSS